MRNNTADTRRPRSLAILTHSPHRLIPPPLRRCALVPRPALLPSSIRALCQSPATMRHSPCPRMANQTPALLSSRLRRIIHPLGSHAIKLRSRWFRSTNNPPPQWRSTKLLWRQRPKRTPRTRRPQRRLSPQPPRAVPPIRHPIGAPAETGPGARSFLPAATSQHS